MRPPQRVMVRVILLLASDVFLRPTPRHVHAIGPQQRIEERTGDIRIMVLGHQRRSVGNTKDSIGLHHRKAIALAWASDRLTSAECPRDPDSRGRSQHWGIHVSIYSCDGGWGNREI